MNRFIAVQGNKNGSKKKVMFKFFRMYCYFQYIFVNAIFFYKLGFTPYKTEQPLQGMQLLEKEAQKD